MPMTMPVQEMVREETVKWVWPRPITFEEFLEVFGPKDFVELVDGVAVEQTSVGLMHEKLRGWLYTVLHIYVRGRGAGIVLGSRIAARIGEFRGRLPDVFF